ncbi:hypothetical protein BN1723_010473 [Verticillium longisporum]|uniref:Uncharacterized protein n=1 Tax=Verticillium longisporum TaxID=100787 RepID=A0A0G4KYK1_VERLO|nr:hypothetical protein BN1723_010473 [Verticillium longisporum]
MITPCGSSSEKHHQKREATVYRAHRSHTRQPMMRLASLFRFLLVTMTPLVATCTPLATSRASKSADPTIKPFKPASRFFPSPDRPFPGFVPSADSAWSCSPPSVPGPAPPDCPAVYGAWHDREGSLLVPKESCVSRANGSCEALICAAREEVLLRQEEVWGLAARMMNPVQVKCVVVGRGGVWRDEGRNLSVEIRRSKDSW